MSTGANTNREQLYTKRCFVQVNNDDKIVRLLRSSNHPSSRKQQRHILLIPVVAQSRARDDLYPNLQSNLVSSYPDMTQGGGTRVDSYDGQQMNKFLKISENNQANGIDNERRTTTENIRKEKSVIEQRMENIRNETSQIVEPSRHSCNFAADETMSAIKDVLELLLHGQHKIGLRLDSLQREQVKSKQELQGDLTNIKDELKDDMVGKTVEQSVELETVKVKQELLRNEVSILNLRLEEMERLVSSLLHETNNDDLTKLEESKKPVEAEESTKSESLQSVLSISSGSSAEDPSSQQRRTRKPSQAFLFSQNIDEPKVMEITHL